MATVDLFATLAALRDRLEDMAGYNVADYAFINKEYDPTGKTIYVAEDILPGNEIQITNDQTEMQGIWQLTVWTKAGTGPKAGMDRATALKNHFKPKTQIGEITIDRATASNSPIQNGDWYGLPVSVYFRTYATTSI